MGGSCVECGGYIKGLERQRKDRCNACVNDIVFSTGVDSPPYEFAGALRYGEFDQNGGIKDGFKQMCGV